jgi:hypothetical protein
VSYCFKAEQQWKCDAANCGKQYVEPVIGPAREGIPDGWHELNRGLHACSDQCLRAVVDQVLAVLKAAP